MSRRVVSTQSILVDMTLRVPSLPPPGGDVIARPPVLAAGGGFNLLYAVAQQDVEVEYAGIRGIGPYGALVARALDGIGVAVSEPDRRGDTGLCVTLLDDGAERTFVTAPGVESTVRLDQLRRAVVAPRDLVAVSGYDLVYEEAADALLTWLGELPEEVVVLLDPGPLVDEIRPDRWRTALENTDILTLNEQEADRLGSADDLVEQLGRSGLATGSWVVVRRGAHGCTVHGGPDGRTALAVPSVAVEAVDTTGAGDTHAGVLLAALAQGIDLVGAVRRGNLAAAISVTRLGPATAPSAREVDDLLAEQLDQP